MPSLNLFRRCGSTTTASTRRSTPRRAAPGAHVDAPGRDGRARACWCTPRTCSTADPTLPDRPRPAPRLAGRPRRRADDPIRTGVTRGDPGLREHRGAPAAMSTRPDLGGRSCYDEVVPARAPWSHVVEAGQILRIVDLEGNQAVDCILYNAHDPDERYSAPDTIVRQRNIFLTTGTELMSSEGRRDDDDRRRHLRSPRHHRRARARASRTRCATATTPATSTPASRTSCTTTPPRGMGKRDMVSNINWFMNVPVEADGTLGHRRRHLGARASTSTCGPRWTRWSSSRTARRSTTRATGSTRRRSA